MTYDGLVLAAVVAELEKIVGSRIEKIRQHNSTDLTFITHSKAGEYRLFTSVDSQFPRIYLTASNIPVPQNPPNFCMLLRKYVQGSFITDIKQMDFDRVLHIRTEAPDGNRCLLIMEIMGRHSNLILVSDTGKILGAAKNISAAVSRQRQVLPGRDYVPPPGKTKESPITIEYDRFNELWQEAFTQKPDHDQIKSWLMATMNGTGPFLAEEIILRAEDTAEDRIWTALQSIADHVRNREYLPVLITDERGKSVMVYPAPSLQFPPAEQHERGLITEALDAYYRQKIGESKLETARTELMTAMQRSIASRKQGLVALRQAIEDGAKAERYKNLGDLVLANLGTIQKGEPKAKIIDYYDPDMPEIEIDLDPLLSPKENAERLFRRYQKIRDGAEAAKDRIGEIETELRILESAREDAVKITGVDALKNLRNSLVSRGVLRKETIVGPGKKAEPEFGGARIRKVESPDGWEILYGESAEANDYLTTKVARPSDMWLHARSITGAHVIIRTNNRPEAIPKTTLIEAAKIAARNSDAKHSSLVPIDYTLRKYVRKPRGAAPGFVRYQNEKTMDITPQ